MHILDRLSKDLALLMERELTKPHADPQRLYIALLLLIGWQRGVGPSSTNQARRPRLVSAEELAAFEPEEPDGDDALDTATEEPRPAATDNLAFAEFVREAPFTHRNPYLSGLLFRDYYASHTSDERWLPGLGAVKIHAEASLYVEEVLWLKALGLAKSNGDKPTNLHLLLRRLCQLSRAAGAKASAVDLTASPFEKGGLRGILDDGGESPALKIPPNPPFAKGGIENLELNPSALGAWADTDIVRRKDGKSIGLDVLWFRKTALALREQAKRLGERMGATARNRREASGPYWLETGGCAETVGEELSLGDIIGIVPLPLQSGFATDGELAGLLLAVVKSLNKQYVYLRACGLPPQDWLHRDEPSINQLKELKTLRECANQSEAWQKGHNQSAFEAAFTTLQAQGKEAPGGFADFNEWLDSDVGQTMLRERAVSLSEIIDGEEDFDLPDHNADPAEIVQSSSLMAEIMADVGPMLAKDAVLTDFFREVLVGERLFVGPGGLLENDSFQLRVAQSPEYARLAPDQLGERLFYQARGLIASVLQETANTSLASPVALAFLRWVVIEEKSAKTLFKQKSFQTELAKEARFSHLPLDLLTEALHEEALRLLAQWLDARGE